MATRETRRERGRRHGDQAMHRVVNELRIARQSSGLSQAAAASHAGWSQTELSRFERGQFSAVSMLRLFELAAVLGFETSVSLHVVGDGVRDAGHQAAIRRFLTNLSPTIRHDREVPLPNPGDRRSWDLFLRVDAQRVGIEVETRIRDVQALVRRIRERERDGGADEILLVLADSMHNRHFARQLLDALGPRFATSPRKLTAALRSGQPLPGSGVLFV